MVATSAGQWQDGNNISRTMTRWLQHQQDNDKMLLPYCRTRTAANCVVILLLGGFLLQLLWSRMAEIPRRFNAEFVPLRPSSAKLRATLTNVSCSGHLGLLDCLTNTSWNYQPPALLEAACRQSASGETKTRHLVLVFVPVKANMSGQRAIVRQTWGRSGSGFELFVFLVQLLGDEPPDPVLLAESALFGDIFLMRGPTEDSYQCLTLKVLAFLRWYSDSCRGVFHYLLKADHDSYWNMKSLNHLLRQRLRIDYSSKNHSTTWNAVVSLSIHAAAPPVEILGGIQRKAAVHRHNTSKFCTPPEAYAPIEYPNYALGGPGYIISDAAVHLLMEAANRVAPFWLEDVYITGILAAASVPVVKHGHMSDIYYEPSAVGLSRAKAVERPPLGIHGLSMKQLSELHAWLSDPLAAARAKQFHLVEKLT